MRSTLIKTLKFFLRFFTKQIEKIKSDRLYFIRFLLTALCINFVAFTSLSSINLLSFINPFIFLKGHIIDQRNKMLLFYPPAFSFQKKEEANSQELTKVKQKVYQKKLSSQELNVKDEAFKQELLNNIKYMIQELNIGSESLEGKKVIKNMHLIQYLWLYEKNLVIHLNQKLWEKINKKEQDLIKKSIESSMNANFSTIKEVIWAF